jgi:hypothetical protein
MADLRSGSESALRAADALLRTAGRAVLLRLPAPAIPGDPAEQLGLATPEFQDVEITPVVVQRGKNDGTQELFVSASAIRKVIGSLGYSAAKVLFASAYGMVLDEVVLQIVSVTESELNGNVYLYRVTVQLPSALIL